MLAGIVAVVGGHTARATVGPCNTHRYKGSGRTRSETGALQMVEHGLHDGVRVILAEAH
jgi:hypothetical protein